MLHLSFVRLRPWEIDHHPMDNKGNNDENTSLKVIVSYRSTSFPWFRLRGIGHHPGNDKVNEVFPCACLALDRGNIFLWEKQLIQGKRGEIGQAHLPDRRQLYHG